MISPLVVAEIQRLLVGKKHSHRVIGEMLGVSRNTVGAVALGRHRNIGVDPNGDAEGEPIGPPKRCPTCGGMVYMPCRLCRLRNENEANPRPPQREHDERNAAASAELNLRPEHQVRYQKVRVRRQRMLAAGYV
jgi:hypothetical protein